MEEHVPTAVDAMIAFTWLIVGAAHKLFVAVVRLAEPISATAEVCRTELVVTVARNHLSPVVPLARVRDWLGADFGFVWMLVTCANIGLVDTCPVAPVDASSIRCLGRSIYVIVRINVDIGPI